MALSRKATTMTTAATSGYGVVTHTHNSLVRRQAARVYDYYLLTSTTVPDIRVVQDTSKFIINVHIILYIQEHRAGTLEHF
jgi:hypothetical protein